jgi:hypothetical protein
MELLIRKEVELKDLENSQPNINIIRNEKTCLAESTRVWPNDHLIRLVPLLCRSLERFIKIMVGFVSIRLL